MGMPPAVAGSRQYNYLMSKRSRMPMPKPTIRQEINKLKYKVGQNKREVQTRQTTLIPLNSTTTGFEDFFFNPCEALVGSARHRELVTGDRWRNHHLVLRLKFDYSLTLHARVVVYYSNDADTQFVPTHILQHLDPSAFNVLYDECFNPDGQNNVETYQRRINLRRIQSIFNGSASDFPERGNIRVCIMTTPTTSTTEVGAYSYLHAFSNI